MTPRLLILAVVLALFLIALCHAPDLAHEAEQSLTKDTQVVTWGRELPPYVVAMDMFVPPVRARARTAPIQRTTMRAASVSAPVVTGEPSDAQFDTLAGCESGGRWDTNTGNGYYGGLQFSASTWHAYGGTGLASEHPRETQIEIARRLWRARGWQPWPTCSRKLGWR